MHLRTHALEFGGDNVRRAVLFEADFRMRMQIVANSLEIAGEVLNPGQYRHVVSFVFDGVQSAAARGDRRSPSRRRRKGRLAGSSGIGPGAVATRIAAAIGSKSARK